MTAMTKEDPDSARMAEAMVRGALWSQDRLHRANKGVEPVCACGHPRCTLHHAMFDCPNTDAVRRTAGPLAEQAWAEQQLGRLGHSPALWTRGIVPKSLQGAPLVASPPVTHCGDEATVDSLGVSHILWTDGPGRCPQDRRRRTCSWAVTAGGEAWIRGTLPGQHQTVFRAELYAVVKALESTGGAVRIATDCQGVVRKALAFLGAHHQIHPRTHHADLWKRAQVAAAGRSVNLVWVPSHLGEEAVLDGRTAFPGPTGSAMRRPTHTRTWPWHCTQILAIEMIY